MNKIAFVTSWYGENITGGAEAETRDLVKHLSAAGHNIEVLTTCVRSFSDDWNKDYYKPGEYTETGVVVRRFKTDKRNAIAFDAVNLKLMNGQKISADEERVFIREIVNSQDLYRYMEEHQDEYKAFIFIPYMFGPTYYGSKINFKKAVLIPCFHDESYFYMDIFKDVYSKVAAIVYNALPEQQLVHQHYNLEEHVKEIVMGIGMDTDIAGDAERFRNKYQIASPFILYAGRKDKGKNVDTLLTYFAEYKSRNGSDMKLVLIGGGQIDIPELIQEDVIDLGFVDVQDKYDACAAAEFLCQPSQHESFSLVIMESWLCERPVLVSGKCAVTKNFVQESNGGLYFDNYFEFEGAVKYLIQNKKNATAMGKNGKTYVKEHFSWDVIISKYEEFLSI